MTTKTTRVRASTHPEGTSHPLAASGAPPPMLSGLGAARRSTENLVKRHPAVAAGALLGAGMLVGALAQRALRHQPTVGEVVMRAIGQRTTALSKKLAGAAATGLHRAGARARKASR